MESPRVNVADALAVAARAAPDRLAVVECGGGGIVDGGMVYWSDADGFHAGPKPWDFNYATFGHLNRDADLLARGMIHLGVKPRHRIALLVRPSIEFVTLVFALLRTGATMVLVDSGLGRKNIVRCLASTEPDGFVAIPLGHLLRLLKRRSFVKAKVNVNVGPAWLPFGKSLDWLRKMCEYTSAQIPHTTADDPAAIVFTSGSTGPPKGVVYRHETFATQLAEIERMYGLEAGGTDLACFPLFGLFNVALGITTVLPEMDFSRPAKADPKKLLAAANQFEVTQSFASPAVWDKLSRHCEHTGERIPTLKRVLSCGAPVPAGVLKRTLACVHPQAEMHTPYGATEALPISTIEAQEVLDETAAKTAEGAGVCVGRKVESIEWRVIEISDDPIATIEETKELPLGEIGELIVRGPQVSRQYLSYRRAGGVSPPVNNHEANDPNALAKIRDGDTIWHRMGDVGYFDDQGRFWYCGRKSQRVVTKYGTLFTECVEAQFNHGLVQRSALVGISNESDTTPVLVVEDPKVRANPPFQLSTHFDRIEGQRKRHARDTYIPIGNVLLKYTLPTDIRHNAKINREKLAEWAAKKLKKEH